MTKQENGAVIAGYCILIILMISFAACTSADSLKNGPVITQVNPASAGNQQPPGPVSITINSAEKLPKLNNLAPLGGGSFLVINLTIKNNDVPEGFDLVNTSLTLLNTGNGEFIPESLNAKPGIRKELGSSLLQPARIKQHENVTGKVVFDVADSTDNVLNLVDKDKNVLTSLPVVLENQAPAWSPVTVTINSARKLARVNEGGLHTRDGNIFVVLDITVKNNDVREGFDFTRSSMTLLNLESSRLVNQSSNFPDTMDRPLEKPLVMPVKIGPGEAINGQIIFRIFDSARYRLNLVGTDQKMITSRPVSFESLATTDHPLSVTIHSVEKRYTLNEIRTGPGEVFVIINATVKNNDLPDGFYFYGGSTTLRDLAGGRNLGFSFNEKKDYGQYGVENAFVLPCKIRQNDAMTGNLVFATANSDTYLLNFVDYDDTILLSRTINA